MKIVFFDTETTGKPLRYDAPASDTDNWGRLVQLAFKKTLVTPDQVSVLSRGSVIVKPEGYTIPSEATAIHGISTERALVEGKPLSLVVERFLSELFDADLVVAHNVSFDRNTFLAEMYRLGADVDLFASKEFFCNMKATTGWCELPGPYGFKYPRLEELHVKVFGTGFSGAHDAMVDVDALERVFVELFKRGVLFPGTMFWREGLRW